jgi:uncharacterized phage-associated protein
MDATHRANSSATAPAALETVTSRQYSAGMTVSAHDVAAVLRERLPGLPTLKLHKLLYYTQAHHLVATGQPLFGEAVSAWDMGPVVAPLWQAEREKQAAPPRRPLGDTQLNIVDYVVTRYGNLSGADLMHLTHAEDPWLLADRDRPAKGSVRIRNEWMRDYFRDEPHDEGEVWFSQAQIAALTADVIARGPAATATSGDESEQLRAQLDELEAQLSA